MVDGYLAALWDVFWPPNWILSLLGDGHLNREHDQISIRKQQNLVKSFGLPKKQLRFTNRVHPKTKYRKNLFCVQPKIEEKNHQKFNRTLNKFPIGAESVCFDSIWVWYVNRPVCGSWKCPRNQWNNYLGWFYNKFICLFAAFDHPVLWEWDRYILAASEFHLELSLLAMNVSQVALQVWRYGEGPTAKGTRVWLLSFKQGTLWWLKCTVFRLIKQFLGRIFGLVNEYVKSSKNLTLHLPVCVLICLVKLAERGKVLPQNRQV